MANTAIRGVPVHFGIDVDSWRWLRSQNAWRAPWPAYIVVPFRAQQHARNSVDFLCFTMARGHFAAFSCPTGCALTIGFSWFCNGPRAFCGTSMFNLMRAICWISFVLQWPAGISLHFHCPRALCVHVRGQRTRHGLYAMHACEHARAVDNFNARAWACGDFYGVQCICRNAQ